MGVMARNTTDSNYPNHIYIALLWLIVLSVEQGVSHTEWCLKEHKELD